MQFETLTTELEETTDGVRDRQAGQVVRDRGFDEGRNAVHLVYYLKSLFQTS